MQRLEKESQYKENKKEEEKDKTEVTEVENKKAINHNTGLLGKKYTNH